VGDAALSTARPSGMSAFRFTLLAEEIKNKNGGAVPDLLDPTKSACLNMVLAFDQTNRSVVMYPCRNFEILNFVCIVPDMSLKEATSESWSAAGDREELISLFTDFPPAIVQYFKYAIFFSTKKDLLLTGSFIDTQRILNFGNFEIKTRFQRISKAVLS
jgi:salicylate hydroxylase